MSWSDRLLEAAYTSPSGLRITFDYEDVGVEFDKQTAAFNFPDGRGTYVQDLGVTGRRYALRFFLWGENYDQDADQLLNMLAENGAGVLEHPLYGVIDVVPFGRIRRRDNLTTGANQAVFDITFFETTDIIYPTNIDDPISSIRNNTQAFNNALAEQSANDLQLDTASEQVLFRNDYRLLLDQVVSGLDTVENNINTVSSRFRNIEQSIKNSLNILVEQPLNLMFQTVQLLQEPARLVNDIKDRFSSYESLFNLILTSHDSTNDFYNRKGFGMGLVSSAVLTTVNTTFETKPEAISYAEQILDFFDQVNEWSESGYTAIGEIDTGESYQQLQQLTALTAGYLVQLSFSLKQEITVTLDRDRTLVDFLGEVYSSIDDNIDFFINSNSLTGSEILELPRGREVVYYI